MSSSIIDQDFPYDIIHRGSRDAQRHNKRVNDAVRKQLKDIISRQDIITSEGNKKVKVRLKYLDQFRFIHSRDKVDVIGRDEFDELEPGETLFEPEPGGGGDKGGEATDDPGEDLYEAEYTIDELTDIMMSELELPNFDEKKKNEIVSDVVEWTDIRKRSGVHSLINKKRTLLANILRKKKMKSDKNLPIINDDWRFRAHNIVEEKHSNAVVFLMMDRSGSMWQDKIYAVKVLYFWIVQFLKRRYNKVEIKFIAHDYNARELPEREFFTISDSGGTRVSAAYEMCQDMVKHNYPVSQWNIYCFHASDGDSWSDYQECVDAVTELVTTLGASLFAYTEINIDNWRQGPSELWSNFEQLCKDHDNVLMSEVQEVADVLDAIKVFLSHSHEVH